MTNQKDISANKSKSFMITLIYLLLILSLCFPAYPAKSDISNPATLFFNMVNSPRSAAMGQCIVNVADEQASLYNPGAMGLFHLDQYFAISLPNKTEWFPLYQDDIHLRTFNVSGGISSKLINAGQESNFNFCHCIGYSRTEYSRLSSTLPDETGNPYIAFQAINKTNHYSVAIGLEYYLRIGLGFANKKFNSHLVGLDSENVKRYNDNNGNAYDYGLIAELPLMQIKQLSFYIDKSQDYQISFDLTPSIAYVMANKGDSISYISIHQTDPLPEISRTGLSLSCSIRINDQIFLSSMILRETEKDLVGDPPDKLKKRGQEIGFLGFFYYRWGRIDDKYGTTHIKTNGYGINLNGLISKLGFVKRVWEKELFSFFAKNLNLRYDYAKYEDNENTPLADTRIIKLSLSF